MKTKTGGRVVCALCAVFLLAGCRTTPPAPFGGNPLDGLERLRGGETMRSSSCDPDWVNGNADARPIAPGKTLTIAAALAYASNTIRARCATGCSKRPSRSSAARWWR